MRQAAENLTQERINRMSSTIEAVVFDIGGVLLDWDPRNLYNQLIENPDDVETFLRECGIEEWNIEMDRGLSPAQAVADLTQKFPDRAALITAWKDRWLDMIKGAKMDVVALMRRLKDQGVPLYSITNFNGETFKIAAKKFDFLNWFDGIVVSGDVGLIKPDPAIYKLLLGHYNLKADTLYFTDDRADNVAAARNLGFHSDVFVSGDQLEGVLKRLRVLT
jgi:2-haloacid dehalogenase